MGARTSRKTSGKGSVGPRTEGGDLYAEPPKRKTTVVPPAALLPSTPRPSESVAVLSLGEAAGRLGMTRTQVEAMIDAGKVEAFPTGFNRMIPTREVERLSA